MTVTESRPLTQVEQEEMAKAKREREVIIPAEIQDQERREEEREWERQQERQWER